MKPRPPLPGGPYLIVGLARSGVAAALALRARGEEVIGFDSGAPGSAGLDAAAGRLYEAGVEVHLDASGDALAARAGTLIKSPGVPQSAPVVVAARSRGVPVLGELELAWRLVPNQFVAVTGTNGKTTTTEWIGHIHRQAALEVAVVGNVGTAASSLVGAVQPEATIVCEASSFQLEDTEAFAPEAAVLLNLEPDHLDRHPSYEDYVAAKLRVFANQGDYDVAVAPDELDVDDLGGCARRVTFGATPSAELSDRAGYLWWAEEPLLEADAISLPGIHNRSNAMAAAAVCLARGVDRDAVVSGLSTFAGVAHRLELIAAREGIAFVNDSKATNVASTLVALRSYRGGVHLIAGGRGKQQDFSPLAAVVAERCTAVYLIGEAAGELAAALSAAGVPMIDAGDLERAVVAAATAAVPGETVLLSPACASYDQYPNFEVRGDHFRSLVEAL
ncbi:MAG TPA: UDP-N-acetylmuramoyl-L-alanine--D-glutamate ligase [Solirubrobacteraceae bacterium]|jgi:UDP-N-acetylmuramoylalanine--D-glutamate ligase